MPNDKRNLRTARAADLISQLINGASQDVAFHKPKQLQCLHHGVTFFKPLYPILSLQLSIGDDLWQMHNGLSVRHENCRGNSHTIPCLY